MTTSLYTAHVEVIGGRAGAAKSSDGVLEVSLSAPTELGGSGGGTNPEQLFAAGFAACFLSAMGAVARAGRISIGELRADSSVQLLKDGEGRFALQADIVIHATDIDQASLDSLIQEAEHTCPYSRAVAGNIDVTFSGVVDS